MPAHDPLFHAANLMPAQPENQILHFAQNDRGGENGRGWRNDEGKRDGGRWRDGGGHAMNVHGLIPGFPLPDNKYRGQVSRE